MSRTDLRSYQVYTGKTMWTHSLDTLNQFTQSLQAQKNVSKMNRDAHNVTRNLVTMQRVCIPAYKCWFILVL